MNQHLPGKGRNQREEWVRCLSKWMIVLVFAWEVDSRMLKGKIPAREPIVFKHYGYKTNKPEWLRISGLI